MTVPKGIRFETIDKTKDEKRVTQRGIKVWGEISFGGESAKRQTLQRDLNP